MSTANLPALASREAGPLANRDLIRTLDDVFNMGDVLLHSGMLPSGIRTREAAVAIILKGRELGIPPMEAFSGITVIQGKPTVSPQLMMSLIYRSKEMVGVPKIEDDGTTCHVTMTRKGGEPHTESFGMNEAKGLGLSGKDNWIKQPKTMRKWRAIAQCARIVFPDVIGGMYLHEELGAQVTDEGDYVEGGTIDPPAPAKRPPAENSSGYGRGEYASPEDTQAFVKKFEDWLSEQNARWLDLFTDPDTGEVHKDHKELMNSFQARGRMLKWCIETERLDPKIIPENVKAGQKDKYIAVVYHRDRKAFGQEMQAYLERAKILAWDVFYRKNPDIAPAEWHEAQAQAKAGAESDLAPPPERKKAPSKKEKAEQLKAVAEQKEEEIIDVEAGDPTWPEGRE